MSDIIVKKGDTLSSIAKKYGTTVNALLAENNIKSPDEISIGLKLRLPSENKGLVVEQATSGKPQQSKMSVASLPQQFDRNTTVGKQINEQGVKLAQELYNQIQGPSMNYKTEALLKKINTYNIISVLKEYKNLSKGKESLSVAIDAEWGLDITTVKAYVCKPLVEAAKKLNIQGIYHSNYMKIKNMADLNNWIETVSGKIEQVINKNTKPITKNVTKKQKPENVNYSSYEQDVARTQQRHNQEVAKARQLAKDLYNQIQGPSLNYKTEALLKKINKSNVAMVWNEYKKITKDKETLAEAIDDEIGLDISTVKKYIVKPILEYVNQYNIGGIYYRDYQEIDNIDYLNNWIENSIYKIKSPDFSIMYNLARNDNNMNVISILNKQDAKLIAKDLYDQINGPSRNSRTVELLSVINPNNVMSIMTEYSKLTNGDETLTSGINKEWGLDYKTVKKYVGDNLLRYGLVQNIDLRSEIPESNNSSGADVEKIINKIFAKILSQEKAPSSQGSFVKYLDYLGSEFWAENAHVGYRSMNYLILTDPTIKKADKIKAIKKAYSSYKQLAKEKNINIDDIIADANRDFQELMNTGNFKRFAGLFDGILDRLHSRGLKFKKGTTNEKVNTNGKIDRNFKQGTTGDCWLLASIKGISLKPRGLEILNNSLKANPDGSVTVYLKGVDKTYLISRKELENSQELSTGDGDVRAIEIAVNKYLREEYDSEDYSSKPSITGNYMQVAYYILTGKGKHLFDIHSKTDKFLNPEFYGKNIDDKLIDSFTKPDRITSVSSHKKGSSRTIQTSGGSCEIISNHAYTVSRADSKYVYLIDPHDTSKEVSVPRKTFKEFFDHVESFDL